MEVQIITVLEVIHKKRQLPGGQNNTTESTFTTLLRLNPIHREMHIETLMLV